MKLLVVNNHSRHIRKILKEFKKVRVVDFKSLNKVDYDNYDAVILSGGYPLPVKYHEKEYSEEIKLIKKYKKPILGICLGFELINFAYGEKLKRQKKRTKGEISIKLISESRLFTSFPKRFKVYEAHKWIVSENKFLETLALSKDGVEAVKHPRKEIYGVQFHPEIFVKNSHTKRIFKNFIEIVNLTNNKTRK